MTKLKVKVTVYKQQLCIETVDLKNTDDDFVPCGDGRIGCVLINTKNKLGLSEEAVVWLRNLKKSCDDIGDVDTFITGNGKGCFSSLGGMFSIKGDGATGSRTHDIDAIPYITITNDTPATAMRVIEDLKE